MALYGAISVARSTARSNSRSADRFNLQAKGDMGMLLRPQAWTSAYAWKPAGPYGDWDSETATVCKNPPTVVHTTAVNTE